MERLQTILHVVLVCCVILSTQSFLTVRLLFEVRQGYIAQTLCENRDRPEMECDGFCFLSKKLAEEQQRKDQERRTAAFELIFSTLTLPAVSEVTPLVEPIFPSYLPPTSELPPANHVLPPQPPPPRVA